jgi:hypothetical protein
VPESSPPLDRVRDQLAGLDRHLELIADIDTELVEYWRGCLSTLVVEPPYGDVGELARHIAETVEESSDRAQWRSLDRKARKVLEAVHEIRNHPWLFGRVQQQLEPVETRIAREEARLRGVESALADLEADLRLADCVQASARQLLGNPEITFESGRDGLTGWQLRVLQGSGRTPLRWTMQRA